jgi:hypothetical protein
MPDRLAICVSRDVYVWCCLRHSQPLQLFSSVAATGRTAVMDGWWHGGAVRQSDGPFPRRPTEALTFLGTADGRSSQISGTAFLITTTSPAKFHLLSLPIITVTMFAARQAFSQAQRRAFSVSARQVSRPCSSSAAPRHCACFFLRFGYVNACLST